MAKNIEIAAFNLESALVAAQVGVDRIEFCADYHSGGITPSTDDFRVLRKTYLNPIYIMIRPRGGDFIYTPAEIEIMGKSILEFRNLGADGYVFGVLDADYQVDVNKNKYLVGLCNSLPVTFHRAFDRAKNPSFALQTIIDCGFKNILSSGGEKCVSDGVSLLTNLQIQAKDKISFIAGGGVRSDNLEALIHAFKTDFYHSSAIVDASYLPDIDELLSLVKIVKSF